MKVLFNCSTNVVGGAVQNAYNYIFNALKDNENDWMFLVSPQVYDQLLKMNGPDNRVIKIVNSPSKNLESRKLIQEHEKQFNPDLVYTMAGPAYVSFKNYHVMGISNPYLTHARFRTYIYGRGFFESVQLILTALYQAIYVRRANFFFFQTGSSRNAFCKRYRVRKDKTALVPNAISNIFTSDIGKEENASKSEQVKIFCPAAPYPHKGLHTLPLIAKRLQKSVNGQKFQFVTTLPSNSNIWKRIEKKAKWHNVQNLISNIGPFNHSEAPRLHNDADIIFIPSVLETFSTSYLEGIISKKPLLVSDLPFAEEVCGDHAHYIKPFSIGSAVTHLSDLITNLQDYKQNITAEDFVLKKFGDQKDRYNVIKENLKKIENTYLD